MVRAERIGHLLRVKARRNAQQEIAKPLRGSKNRRVVGQCIVLHQTDQEAAVSPKQGEVVVARLIVMECAAKIAIHMLLGNHSVNHIGQQREGLTKAPRGRGQGSNPTAGKIAGEVRKPAAGAALNVFKQELGSVDGSCAVKDAVAREAISGYVGAGCRFGLPRGSCGRPCGFEGCVAACRSESLVRCQRKACGLCYEGSSVHMCLLFIVRPANPIL